MKTCDHTSVGALVFKADRLLLIQRKKPPFGFAPPAGHVDQHGTFFDAVKAELLEEVGLALGKATLIGHGLRFNRCRRTNGTYHTWNVYRIDEWSGDVRLGEDEARAALWASHADLVGLATNTLRRSQNKKLDERLEPVWVEWLTSLDVLRLPPT